MLLVPDAAATETGIKHLTFPRGTVLSYVSSITMTSWWARWRLKSPASRLFTQPFIQAQIKENIKVPRHWPLWGEFTGDRWIPRTNDQLRGKCFHLMTSSWAQPFESPPHVEVKPWQNWYNCVYPHNTALTHGITSANWWRNRMDKIVQTAFSNAFSGMHTFEFWIKFPEMCCLGSWLTIFQHWFG